MQSSDRKRDIALRALELFSQKGYDGVSVDEIAAAAGIKGPSLYKHFSGKKDILDYIISIMENGDTTEANKYQMPLTCDGAVPSRKRIYEYVKSMFAYFTENETAAMFRRMLELQKYSCEKMRKLYALYVAEGPLEYMTQVFSHIYEKAQAKIIATQVYGSFYLYLGIYDRAENKQQITKTFFDCLDATEKQNG